MSINTENDLNVALLNRKDVESQNSQSISDDVNEVDDEHKNKLGTINGCYVPCLLNIMGIILFERLGWGIGQVGVSGVLLIFLIAESQAIITVLSLCAIVTNGTMRGGGSYYMISRTLGPEFGGSIGILFYAAYCVGVAFYSSGFSDELVNTWFEHNYWLQTAFSSAVLFICLIIALIGASCFTKINVILFFFQFMAIFIALLACFFRGTFDLSGHQSPCLTADVADGDYKHYEWTMDRFRSIWDVACSDCITFAATFGVLFPAATGIMEGANLSGDLANPTYSIPVGTLAAIATSIVFYILLIIAFAGSFNDCTLRNDTTIMQESAWGDIGTYLVIAGIIISASSSALGSLFGGSRVLQAIARDKLFPYITVFEYGSAQGDEPRTCVLMTWFIAQALVFVGGINVIAPISTSFFCLSYATVNFSCFLLSITGTPNFRPSFKFYSWHICLFGTISNLAVMFYVDWMFGFVALAIEILMFGYLVYRSPDTVWGDVTQALMFHQVRKYLLRLDERKKHSKSWRPSILLLADSKYSAAIDFCNNLKKGGLYIIGVTVDGEYGEFHKTIKIRKQWIEFIDSNGLKAFPQITIAPNIRNGMENLILLSGLGALQPNTIMLPMIRISKEQNDEEIKEEDTESKNDFESLIPQSPASMNAAEYTQLLRNVLRFNKNIVITANFKAFDASLIASDAIREKSKISNYEMQQIQPYLSQKNTIGSEAFLSESIAHEYVANVALSSREGAQWIDVWLFASDYSFNRRNIKKIISHNKCDDLFPMFMMQLSHILLRNKAWREEAKVKVRVLLIVNDDWNESDKDNFDAICKKLRLNEISDLVILKEEAKDHQKVEWESIINGTEDSSTFRQYYNTLNKRIKSLSDHTYFTFIQLPHLPPQIDENQEMNAKLNMIYYNSLYVLLRGLPPTLLCQTGEIDPVISVDL